MKILIVDDEVVLRELTADVLIERKLFSEQDIVFASNGKKALELYLSEKPDLIITDMMMPEMNGAEFIQNVRHLSKTIPIVVMTGFADMDMAVSVIKDGVFELVRKPFVPDEMALAVGKVMEKIQLEQQYDESKKRLVQAEKMASIGLLAAGVAHEINNPTTFIKGNLELLKEYYQIIESELNRSVQSDNNNDLNRVAMAKDNFLTTINSALNGCERIRLIVSGLLSFSRTSRHEKASCEIHVLIDDARILVQHRLKKHKIVMDIPEGLKKIYVNAQEMTQVLMNLLVNAIDAIEEMKGGEGCGEVHIRVRDDLVSHTQSITIEDNGIGISPQSSSKIFDPFYTTKQPHIGTGLGLSIVKGNVEMNGGTIDFKSRPKEGSTFILVLPHEKNGTH